MLYAVVGLVALKVTVTPVGAAAKLVMMIVMMMIVIRSSSRSSIISTYANNDSLNKLVHAHRHNNKKNRRLSYKLAAPL
jgi:hypothetical protein